MTGVRAGSKLTEPMLPRVVASRTIGRPSHPTGGPVRVTIWDTSLPRPGSDRSWWLGEALSAEGEVAAAPPLEGEATADVVIVGGGYTGLWTAWFLAEHAPGTRIVLLEQDVCGGGPSGR